MSKYLTPKSAPGRRATIVVSTVGGALLLAWLVALAMVSRSVTWDVHLRHINFALATAVSLTGLWTGLVCRFLAQRSQAEDNAVLAERLDAAIANLGGSVDSHTAFAEGWEAHKAILAKERESAEVAHFPTQHRPLVHRRGE